MKRLSRGEKWLAGAGLASLLLVGSAATLLRQGKTTIPAPLPLPSPNGFDVYVAASRALVPANPPVDAINDTRVLTPQQAAINYAPARRRAWIAANAPAWALFACAKTLPSRCPNLRGVITVPAMKMLRVLARAQSVRVHEWKSQGQWNAAMNGGLDTMGMGRDIERGAPLIGSLVGIAIEHIGEHPVEDVPAHLSATEAGAAARRLETLIQGAQPFAEVLREEKWNSLTMVNGAMSTSRLSLIAPLLRARSLSGVSSMMDDFIAQTGQPMLLQKSVPAPSGLASLGNLAGILYPVFNRALMNDTRRQSLERLLLLRLALRAFRAKHGVYPAQLADLTPAILTRVPVDPFGSGEPFRYRKTGDSYTAWSIGPDGIDNGGTPIKPRRGQKRAIIWTGSKGDVVARP